MNAYHVRNMQQSEPQHLPNKEKKINVKVKSHGWITKGEKIIYSLVFMTFIITGIFLVSFSSATDTLNRNVQALEQQVESQKVTNGNLMFEVKELSRPERILEIAEKNGLKIQDAEVKQVQSFSN